MVDRLLFTLFMFDEEASFYHDSEVILTKPHYLTHEL